MTEAQLTEIGEKKISNWSESICEISLFNLRPQLSYTIRPLAQVPQGTIVSWFDTSRITIGDVATTEEQRMSVMRLGYAYKDCFIEKLEDIALDWTNISRAKLIKSKPGSHRAVSTTTLYNQSLLRKLELKKDTIALFAIRLYWRRNWPFPCLGLAGFVPFFGMAWIGFIAFGGISHGRKPPRGLFEWGLLFAVASVIDLEGLRNCYHVTGQARDQVKRAGIP